MVSIDPKLIPDYVKHQLAIATLAAMRRTQREDPEKWAQIEKRAAEIREKGEYGCGK